MNKKKLVVLVCMMLVTSFIVVFPNENVNASDGEKDWWDYDWNYSKQITINHGMVDADLSNFPILIHNTSSDYINHAQSDGDDFVFVSFDNSTKYNHEIEYYNPSTGELVAWVNITSLSSTEDTVLYMYYGNADCGSQEDVDGTWDSNYKAVYHLNETSGSTVYDSTGNSNDATYTGDLPTYTGDLIGGQYFDGAEFGGDWIDYPSGAHVDVSGTHEYYVELIDNSNYQVPITVFNSDGSYRVPDMEIRYADNKLYANVKYGGTSWIFYQVENPTEDPTYYAIGFESGAQTFFRDNIELGTGSISTSSFTSTTRRIGANAWGNRGLYGNMYEYRISNIKRSDAWIITTYNTIGKHSNFLSMGLEIERNQPPIANFTYSAEDREVIFDASASYDRYGKIVGYKWDFGDGTDGNGIVVIHRYADYGKYLVTLNVRDDDGLTDNISKGVIVVDEMSPDISNFQAVPLVQLPGGYVNISAQVTDDGGLTDVCLVIRYPDYHWDNISILENKTGDTYYCNRTYDMVGIYACHIWAIDTSGNSATSLSVHFEIIEELVADADGPYDGYVYEKIQFEGYAVGGVPPYSWHWNFGDGNTSDEQNPIHIYTSPDKYTVILTVTDSENNVAIDDTWAFIPGSIPIPPPIIDGPASGEVGIEYYYSFVTIHHLGYDLSYFIEWGDGEITDWTALLPSGTPYNESHKWTSKGKYIIKAKARDVWGTESDWATFDVTMPRNKISANQLFLRFLERF
ncbi:MAG: DUF2341 domain-containing protein [Thermoplasmatales archaeon]|nr:DUF2341 domain-containing protein [Thermoplasmatales archaeon]